MIYFKILAWVLAALNLSAVVFYFAARDAWKNFMLQQVLPEKKPAWLMPVLILECILVVVTWIQVVQHPRAMTYILSIYLTFGVPKLIFTMMHYPNMRMLFKELVEKANLALHIMMASGLVIGLGLLAIGVSL